jgi:hypothetical protein
MAESRDRQEQEKRLEHSRRAAGLALDPLTKERLDALGLSWKISCGCRTGHGGTRVQ